MPGTRNKRNHIKNISRVVYVRHATNLLMISAAAMNGLMYTLKSALNICVFSGSSVTVHRNLRPRLTRATAT